MIWQAPSWSAASVQHTHGFPRRLVAESHGGFLPGNITITSKASNLSLRRLAICDVAAIVSRQCISGAGLSMARLLNLRYAALRYHSGQYCPQYLLAGMVEYGVNFATFQPLDAEALDLLHDSLRRMWRTEEEERDVSEGELSASSSESSDEAMIPCTFPQSVLQQMRPGGGEVQGSSAGTENPLRSLLASFASGQSDDEDDNSQQPGSQAEEAPPQRARGPNAFGGGRKRKATSASGGGASASKTSRGRAEEVLEEGATAGKMMFSIWNLLSNLFISVSLPSRAKISFLSPRNCLHPGRTEPRGPGRATSAGPLA